MPIYGILHGGFLRKDVLTGNIMFTYSTDNESELKLIIVFAIDSWSIFVKLILGSLENMFRGNFCMLLRYFRILNLATPYCSSSPAHV